MNNNPLTDLQKEIDFCKEEKIKTEAAIESVKRVYPKADCYPSAKNKRWRIENNHLLLGTGKSKSEAWKAAYKKLNLKS